MNDAERDEFVGKLKRWKSEGCSILVVGEALDLLRETGELLLGAEDRPRYRLFVFTDTNPETAASRLPTASDSNLERRTKIIDYESMPRSEAAGTAMTAPNPIPVAPVRGGLDSLYDEATETMAEFDSRADSLDFGALRASIDTVDDLLVDRDREEVRRWLHHLGNATKSYHGIAHALLAKPYDSETVQALAADFDAVIEVRPYDEDGSTRKERWHVPGHDLTTPWRPMDDESRGMM